MSREIRFRAWDNVANEMFYAGEELEVIFTLGSAGIECTDIRSATPSGDGVDSMEHLIYMQYTGLKDRNGVEIYEGDIVKARERSDTGAFTGYVHYLNAQYWVNYIRYESYYLPLIQLHNAVYEPIEVIGNKFEHPNLLGEEQ